MADLNKTSKGILGENAKKIGTFKESTGGGTPLAKGEKLKDHPEAKRVQQPRDENGQFTYNSVNGKELKYGPSRGTTVPPFLKGIKLTFCQPGTKLKISDSEVLIMTIDMSVEQIVANCKRYFESEGGFAGMGEGTSIKKMGRKSKEEKEASTGQVGYVDPQSLSSGTQQKMKEAKKFYEKNSSKNEQLSPTVNGYKVVNDTLNPDGTVTQQSRERYWQYLKNKGLKDIVILPKPETSTPGKVVIDQRMAASNPTVYYSKNKELVDSIVDAFNSQLEEGEEKFTKEDVIDAIARGDINDSIFEPVKTNSTSTTNSQSSEEKKAMDIFGLK